MYYEVKYDTFLCMAKVRVFSGDHQWPRLKTEIDWLLPEEVSPVLRGAEKFQKALDHYTAKRSKI